MSRSTLFIGKSIAKASRLAGNSGTAISGKIMEKLSPNMITKLTSHLDEGVIVVTGTNGKTTTTKMIVELLESQGLKVFTNRSGSNFTRGVLSAMADNADKQGRLDYDIAVLEFDEAYFKHFAVKVNPRLTVVTNLFRDQLDRYGEVSVTAAHIAAGLQYSKAAIFYGGDKQVVELKKSLPKDADVGFYGAKASLRKQLPNDDELHGKTKTSTAPRTKKSVNLEGFKVTKGKAQAEFKIGSKKYKSSMQIRGLYNALNATAALAVAKTVVPKAKDKDLVKALEGIRPAFGRGEVIDLDGKPIVLGLVKNPAGFNQNLKTLITSSTKQILIAANDNFADGRDVSWYWDVDMSVLKKTNHKIYISGVRAYDMALRLKYAGIKFENVDQDIQKVLTELSKDKKELVILPTYTAMLALRKSLTDKEIY